MQINILHWALLSIELGNISLLRFQLRRENLRGQLVWVWQNNDTFEGDVDNPRAATCGTWLLCMDGVFLVSQGGPKWTCSTPAHSSWMSWLESAADQAPCRHLWHKHPAQQLHWQGLSLSWAFHYVNLPGWPEWWIFNLLSWIKLTENEWIKAKCHENLPLNWDCGG